MRSFFFVVFGKSGGNKEKWAVCWHFPAVGGDFLDVNADFSDVGGDFSDVNGDCLNVN